VCSSPRSGHHSAEAVPYSRRPDAVTDTPSPEARRPHFPGERWWLHPFRHRTRRPVASDSIGRISLLGQMFLETVFNEWPHHPTRKINSAGLASQARPERRRHSPAAPQTMTICVPFAATATDIPFTRQRDRSSSHPSAGGGRLNLKVVFMKSASYHQPIWLSNANYHLFLRRIETECRIALQPIVDIHSGQLLACESLVRGVNSIGFGRIEDLFCHAHEINALPRLEELLIRKSLDAFAEIRRSTWALLFLNIDSRFAVDHETLVRILLNATAAHGLSPADICIELSEKHQDLGSSAFETSVAALRREGYLVAIDDFGIGNSGLLMLHKSSPTFVKIDRFFIQSIQEDPRKKAMVSSTVNMCHALGIRVIAEGVETVNELHQCRDIRCDLAQGYLIQRPVTSIGDISTTYAVVSNNPDRRKRASDNLGLHSHIIRPATIDCRASLDAAFETLEKHPEQNIIPVLGPTGVPNGVIRERDLKPFVYSRYGRDLLANRGLNFRLSDFIRPLPVADIETQLSPLLDVVCSEEVDGIIITDGMKYEGYLPSSAVAKLANELRIEAAADRNPLTRLPANSAVKSFIDASLRRTDCCRVMCYVDLDDFKPFNDKYGFRAGDRALLLLADHLKSMQVGADIFVGHIGGDDFFVGSLGRNAACLASQLRNIQQSFKLAAESLYSSEDRQNGYLIGLDRKKNKQHFGLLSCTMAALELPEGESVADGELLAAMLASAKTEAKKCKGSLLMRSLRDKWTEPETVVAAA
jgi:diguanylate cyclase (GGDEF)-like protein